MDNFKSDLHAKIDSKMMEISHLICPTWRGAQGPRDITTKIRCTEYVRRKALRHDRHVGVAPLRLSTDYLYSVRARTNSLNIVCRLQF